MIIGAVVLLRPKGGQKHRLLGYVYVSLMTIMLMTSFALYRLTGGFNVLHISSIMSTGCLVMGIKYAITRRPENHWFALHYNWMSWSYVGLIAAFVAETSTRVALPYLATKYADFSMGLFWLIVGTASALVIWIGARFIHRFAPRNLIE